MRITVGSIAETATALLALSAGLQPAAASAPSAADNRNDILQHNAVSALRHADRSFLQLQHPRHIVGHPIPNYCPPTPTHNADPYEVDIVVAHFNEDLGWLGPYKQNATIYSKNDQYDYSALGSDSQRYHLDNIALETYPYLFHILSHWDCLKPKTIFSQGDPSDSVDNFQGVEELVRRTQSNTDGMILYRNPGTFNEWWGVWHFGKWKDELESGEMRKSDLTPGEFYTWMFNGDAPPEQVEWTWSATFAVTRDAITRRPRRFYKRVFDHFERINHKKPEEGHYMERFWMSVFKSKAGLHRLRDRRHRLSVSSDAGVKKRHYRRLLQHRL